MCKCAAFKIPNMEIDRSDPRYHAGWDEEKKVYTMQIFFTVSGTTSIGTIAPTTAVFGSALLASFKREYVLSQKRQARPLPALPQRPTSFLPLSARW